MNNHIKVIILAGGRGERLRPLTNTTPKPMIQINNKPILEYIISTFAKHNIRDIILSVCYLPNIITDYFGNGKKFGVNISYVYEDEGNPLGTAGSIAKLQKKLTNTFIVCYGDTLRNVSITKLLNQHELEKPIGTICVYKNATIKPKSSVIFNKQNTILSFVERPQNVMEKFYWSNAGLYVFEPEIFKYISQNKISDFGKNIFPLVLQEGKLVKAFVIDGYFLDIGTLEKVYIAENDIKRMKS